MIIVSQLVFFSLVSVFRIKVFLFLCVLVQSRILCFLMVCFYVRLCLIIFVGGCMLNLRLLVILMCCVLKVCRCLVLVGDWVVIILIVLVVGCSSVVKCWLCCSECFDRWVLVSIIGIWCWWYCLIRLGQILVFISMYIIGWKWCRKCVYIYFVLYGRKFCIMCVLCLLQICVFVLWLVVVMQVSRMECCGYCCNKVLMSGLVVCVLLIEMVCIQMKCVCGLDRCVFCEQKFRCLFICVWQLGFLWLCCYRCSSINGSISYQMSEYSSCILDQGMVDQVCQNGQWIGLWIILLVWCQVQGLFYYVLV